VVATADPVEALDDLHRQRSRPLVIVGERWDRALASFRELLLAEGVHFDLIRPAASADAAMEIVLDAG